MIQPNYSSNWILLPLSINSFQDNAISIDQFNPKEMYPRSFEIWNTSNRGKKTLIYPFNQSIVNWMHIKPIHSKDSLTVDPASCNVFAPTDEGEYSVRVYKNGTMFTDHVTIEIDDTSCIELNSVTGKISLCNRNFCLD